MDTLDKGRLALKASAGPQGLDGAWWPRSRRLDEELVHLFAAWPVGAGYMSRVYVSPRDWDETPISVAIPNRRGQVKIGLLPVDTANQMVLILIDGQRLSLAVIPPSAPHQTATTFMGTFGRHVPVSRVDAMRASVER
jgi:hypothetical protein